MKFNNIKYLKLSYFKYHLDDEFDNIIDRNGIYYWVYWPKFNQDTITHDDLIKVLYDYTNKKLHYSEKFKGRYKFNGEISEQWFKINGNIFGFSNKKNKTLTDYLIDRNNIKSFAILFKELCFARPFYIGKANDLKNRLKAHFNYRTDILDQIDKIKIEHSEIWVGYKLIDDPSKKGLNVIFEEFFSRTLKPGLTIKPN